MLAEIRGFIGKVDVTFWKRIQFLARWKVSLATTIAIVLIVIGVRYYYSFVTGFFVPDEIWYYNTFVLDRTAIGIYRPVFVAIFILFFSGTDVWTFLIRGAVYSTVWAVGCVLLFFMIFRRLKVPENMSSLLVLSLPLFPVYIVFVPTILTETPGLFMALLGVYFVLRYVQDGGLVNSLLSGVFLVAASDVHEPYLLFAAGYFLLFLAVSLKRRSPKGIIGYAIPFSSLVTQFARGDYASITGVLSRFASSGGQMNPISSLTGVNLTAWLTFTMPMTAALHPDLLKAIGVALWYGFNPLFALFAVLSVLAVGYDLLRSRSSTVFLLAVNAVCSLGAFIAPVEFLLEAMGGALSGWTSSIIRTTHATLPLIIAFPRFYGRLRVSRTAGLILVLLIVGSTQLGSFATAFQRSLSREPVDRLSFDYRAPYYRLYLLAKDSGRTIVFGGNEMRGIRAYMAMLPNVVLVRVGGRGQPRALNETEFRALLKQGWDSIYLYDDWVTLAIPTFANVYPEFYTNILLSRQYPGYSVQTLWVDGESYALKMTPATLGSNST